MTNPEYSSTDLPSWDNPMFLSALLVLLQAAASSVEECMQLVILFAAHCDDESLGAGGTAHQLQSQRGTALFIVVVAADKPIRREESKAAAAKLGILEERLFLLNFPDGQLPKHAADIRTVMCHFERELNADIVMTHKRDIHFDHNLLHDLVEEVFTQASIINFRIPQVMTSPWNPDTFFRVADDAGVFKTEELLPVYRSEGVKHYFHTQKTLGIMEDAGDISGCRYAEPFQAVRLIVGPCPFGSGSIVLARNRARRGAPRGAAEHTVPLPLRVSRLVLEPCRCGCGRVAVARNAAKVKTQELASEHKELAHVAH